MADTVTTGISNYPIKFNTTEIPFFPSSWSTKINKEEEVMKSEGGSLIVQTIHIGRRSIPMSFSIADDEWLATFRSFYALDSFTLSIYDTALHAYVEKTVRMTGYQEKPKKRSEYLPSVNGVWDVSFTLEDFR